MKRLLGILLALSLVLFTIIGSMTSCLAGTKNGQYALATQKLSLREKPTTKSNEAGTYDVAGDYILVTEKSWDSANSIYWLHVSFKYNGRTITGWTGAKRFDSDTYSLDALPNYKGKSSSSKESSSSKTSSGGQKPKAIKSLSLRAYPTTSSKDLGTYKVKGKRVTATECSWDSDNGIYWLHVYFDYNGKRVEGWTGAQRFDEDSYEIYKLPGY